MQFKKIVIRLLIHGDDVAVSARRLVWIFRI
jgi:hypothetical protein